MTPKCRDRLLSLDSRLSVCIAYGEKVEKHTIRSMTRTDPVFSATHREFPRTSISRACPFSLIGDPRPAIFFSFSCLAFGDLSLNLPVYVHFCSPDRERARILPARNWIYRVCWTWWRLEFKLHASDRADVVMIIPFCRGFESS